MNQRECQIQYSLYRWLRWQRQHRWITPNVREIFSTGECDVFSLNRSGSGYEWEIKVSRADLKNDAKKGAKEHGGKHELLRKRLDGATTFDRKYGIDYRYTKAGVPLITPHYFSYVVPEGLVSADELPDFAGLYYVTNEIHIVEQRKPAKLHSGELPDRLTHQLGEKLMYRFWTERERFLKTMTKEKTTK